MDNAQKAIMIGVGLFITIIVIAAVMLITGIGQDLLNSGTNQLQGLSESLRVQITDQYDGKNFTKTQVRTACIDLSARNQDTIIIRVEANKAGDYFVFSNIDYKKNGYTIQSGNNSVPVNASESRGNYKKTISNVNEVFATSSSFSGGHSDVGMMPNTQKFEGSVFYDSDQGVAIITFDLL